MKRQWYDIRAEADASERVILIYDEIGKSFWNDDSVTAADFVKELQELPSSVKTLKVRINSPGGDPFDAVTIENALRDQRTRKNRAVITYVDGLCASAATIVSCAGSPIRMVDNGLFMVHEPYTLQLGTADEFRTTADALDRVRDSIVATYRRASPKSESELRDMMKKTTWMDAHEAKANGFVTEIVDGSGALAKASIRPELLATFGKVPDRFSRVAALAPAAQAGSGCVASDYWKNQREAEVSESWRKAFGPQRGDLRR